jgi:transcriptional regulator with XRE-family HTH domain
MAKEMKLTIGELVSIFRNRKGLTQAQLGVIVFDDLVTPNVKVKKFEKDQQTPTKEDINRIAAALEIDPAFFTRSVLSVIPTKEERETEGYELGISNKVQAACPNLPTYLQAINSMAKVDDYEVMMVILRKMCREIIAGECIDGHCGEQNNSCTNINHSDKESISVVCGLGTVKADTQ